MDKLEFLWGIPAVMWHRDPEKALYIRSVGQQVETVEITTSRGIRIYQIWKCLNFGIIFRETPPTLLINASLQTKEQEVSVDLSLVSGRQLAEATFDLEPGEPLVMGHLTLVAYMGALSAGLFESIYQEIHVLVDGGPQLIPDGVILWERSSNGPAPMPLATALEKILTLTPGQLAARDTTCLPLFVGPLLERLKRLPPNSRVRPWLSYAGILHVTPDGQNLRSSRVAAAMEVQTFLVQWPADDLRRQAILLRALHVSYWERLASPPIADMPARARFDANFGPGVYTVTLRRVCYTADSHGFPIYVYAPEHNVDDGLPRDVTKHKAFVFRAIPSTTLIINWEFEIDRELLHGTATTMSGDPFGRIAHALEPGFSLSVEALENETKQMAIARGRLFSCNQSVILLLQGSTYQFHNGGIIWSHEFSCAAPHWRIFGKTNLAALRFGRWMAALRGGQLTMLDSPDNLA
eukprot:s1203_g3.t1